MAAAPTTPAEYITGHLTHFTDARRHRRRVLDDPRRHARHHADRRRAGVRLHLVGRARGDGRRARQAAGVRRDGSSTSSTTRRSRSTTGRRTLVAPLAVTTFVLVMFLNAMDFLPVDITAKFTHLFAPHWRIVPTADVNTTFALALSILFADARSSRSARRVSAASSTSCSPRHSASIRCCGRRTS